jgi:hypothetical protein
VRAAAEKRRAQSVSKRYSGTADLKRMESGRGNFGA